MKVSTRGRYALRMAYELAKHYEDGQLSLSDIAESQDISKKYLEQIASLLCRGGVIKATRGTQGGYALTAPPMAIKLTDILRATEGELYCVTCLEYTDQFCSRINECKVRFFWEGLNKAILDYVGKFTLQDIIDHNGGIRLEDDRNIE